MCNEKGYGGKLNKPMGKQKVHPLANKNLEKLRQPFFNCNKVKWGKTGINTRRTISKCTDKLFKELMLYYNKMNNKTFYISQEIAERHKLNQERGLITGDVEIEGTPCNGILDCGSEVTFIKYDVLKRIKKSKRNYKTVKNPKVQTVTEGLVDILGTFHLRVKTQNEMEKIIQISVTNYNYNIFGLNYLRNFKTGMDFSQTQDTVEYGVVNENIYTCITEEELEMNAYSEITIDMYCKELKNIESIDAMVWQAADSEKFIASYVVKITNGFFKLWVQNSSEETITIPIFQVNLELLLDPEVQMINKEDLEEYHNFFMSNEKTVEGKEWVINKFPNNREIKGSMMHLMPFYEEVDCIECKKNDKFCATLNKEAGEKNDTIDPLIIKDNQLPSIAINPTGESSPKFVDFTTKDLEKLFSCYKDSVKIRLLQIFKKFPALARHPLDCGSSVEEMHVPLSGELPRLTQIYPMNSEDSRKLKDLLDFLIVYDIIERCPPTRNFGSPAFLISRKDKASCPRLVIDSRVYNSYIVGSKSCFMLSVFEALRSRVPNCRLTSALDIKNAYYSAKLSKETIDTGYSQFICVHGSFRFKNLLTGGALSPGYFLAFINKYMHYSADGSPSYIPSLLVHYDDLTLLSDYSETESGHMDILETLVERVYRCGLKLSAEKSIFFRDTHEQALPILGFEIFQNKLVVPKSRTDSIGKIGKPTNLKEAQSLLGNLCFIRNFLGVKVIDQMNVLSTKMNPFIWDSDSDKAFKIIMEKLKDPELYLQFPEEGDVIFVYADSSAYSAGGGAFSVNIEKLGLYEDNEDKELIEGIENSLLNKHCNFFNIKLKMIKNGLNLKELIMNLNSIFKLKIGSNWEEIKSSILNSIHLMAPAFLHKIPLGVDQNEKRIVYNPKEFDYLVDQIRKEDFQEFSFELILATLCYQISRRINLIFLSNKTLMKTPYTAMGSIPQRNNPLWITIEKNEGVFHFGICSLEEQFVNFIPSKIHRKLMDNPKEIVTSVFKIFKEKNNVNKQFFKVITWYGKSWNASFRRESIFLKETKALLDFLNYISDMTKGKLVIALTDSMSTVKAVGGTSQNYFQNVKLNKCVAEISRNHPQVKVLHIPGKENVADLLSRLTKGNKDQFFMENLETPQEINEIQKFKAELYRDPYTYYGHLEEINKAISEEHTKKINFLQLSTIEKLFEPYLSVSKQSVLYDEEFYYKVNKGLIPKFSMHLGRIYEQSTQLPVLPEKLYAIYIAFLHSTHNHRSFLVLEKIAKNNYFITNSKKLKIEGDRFKEACLGCQTAKPSNQRNYHGMITANRPRELFMMDLLERGRELKSSKAAYKSNCLLVIIDVYSTFTMTFPLSSNKSIEIIHVLTGIFSIFGPVEKIISDNGTIFHEKSLKTFYKEHGVKQLISAPYLSRARGNVERTIRTIRTDVRAIREEAKSDFIKYVPQVVNTKNNLPIIGEYTPYNLFTNSFGKTGPFTEGSYQHTRTILPTKERIMEESNKESGFLKVKEQMFKRAKIRQAKLNSKIIQKKYSLGKYFLIKTLVPRESENKNKPIYHDNIYICINANSNNLLLKDLITNQIIRRSNHQVKEIKLDLIKALELPDELLAKLPLIKLDASLPEKGKPLKISPAVTRSRKKELDLEDEEEPNLWMDILDEETDDLSKIVRFDLSQS